MYYSRDIYVHTVYIEGCRFRTNIYVHCTCCFFQKLLKCIMLLITTGVKLRVDFQGESGFDAKI